MASRVTSHVLKPGCKYSPDPSRVTAFLWRLFLKTARSLVWVADEWIHKQEQALRETADMQAHLEAVDPQASAAREKAISKNRIRSRKVGKTSRAPRLRYQAGQFVRSES